MEKGKENDHSRVLTHIFQDHSTRFLQDLGTVP